jgi:alpha-glucosidase
MQEGMQFTHAGIIPHDVGTRQPMRLALREHRRLSSLAPLAADWRFGVATAHAYHGDDARLVACKASCLKKEARKRSRHGDCTAKLSVWYRSSVLYQIYPLSFQDSDDDGRGDLGGILSRLDHLSWLGIDAVWLCPVYRSPMDDFGYDVADYQDVDPIFGSLEQLDQLIQQLHARSIRFLLDFVPNHTSDAHAWFAESRTSRTNSKHDWYIWVDPRPDGGPPNNWLSRFGGSAWEWEPRRQQFYLHSFLKSQPDLNLRNPRVRAALADVMRFWLRRGVDGFRIDAAAALAKDAELRDDPPDPDANEKTPPPQRQRRDYSDTRPEAIDWLAEMRKVSEEFPERVLLGEVDTARGRVAKYYGSAERPALHLPLNYLLMEVPWRAEDIAERVAEYLRLVPDHGWPLWGIGGQDKARIATKVGQTQTRNASMLALTLRGTPLFYAGDEIGMHQLCIPSEQALDPFERLVPGYGMNRDPERTPMQWDASANAGFTTGKPWLPLPDDYAKRNVEAQRASPRSLLHLYRELIALRRAEPALTEGALEGLDGQGNLLTYVRRAGARRLYVTLNLGPEPQTSALPTSGRLLLSTHLDRRNEGPARRFELRPDEGLIIAAE